MVRRVSRFRSRHRPEIGAPKFKVGDRIGEFEVVFYRGHSYVNKRTAKNMSKPQHWYRCLCSCGTEEDRSQQELNDSRRSQCCYNCREKTQLTE